MQLWSLQSYFEPWQAHVSPARRNCFCSYTSVNSSVVNTDTLWGGKRENWKKEKKKRAIALFISCKRFFFSRFTVIFSQAEQKQDLQWTAHTPTPIHRKTQILLCTKWSVIGWISGDSGFGGSKCFGKMDSRENCG